jgi:hypothetical protein
VQQQANVISTEVLAEKERTIAELKETNEVGVPCKPIPTASCSMHAEMAELCCQRQQAPPVPEVTSISMCTGGTSWGLLT